MSKMPLPLFILRRIYQTQKPFLSYALLHSRLSSPKLYSTSQLSTSVSEPFLPPRSLSDRMKFVFDKIDSIERERLQKEEALERIRVWRESQKRDSISNDPSHLVSEQWVENDKETELAHPFGEWIEFIEMLIRLKYLGPHSKGEDRKVRGTESLKSKIVKEDIDFTKNYSTLLNAVDKFCKDRFDILSSVSKQDIRYLVGYGCPTSGKLAVNSAKRLRNYVGIVEGDVCCSCSLRSSCNKAFLVKSEGYSAQTVDLLRILLAFIFEPVNGSIANKPMFELKSFKTAARKLLHHIVTLSAVPIDPNLSPPVLELPKKIKPTERPKCLQKKPKKTDPDHKFRTGDWFCPVCAYMNFDRNAMCLKCHRKKLLPREWVCPGCGLVNFNKRRRCHECKRPRPTSDYSPKKSQEKKELCMEGQYCPGITESMGPAYQINKTFADRTSRVVPSPVHDQPVSGLDNFDGKRESALHGNDFTNSPSRTGYNQRHERDDFDEESPVQTIHKCGHDSGRKSKSRIERW